MAYAWIEGQAAHEAGLDLSTLLDRVAQFMNDMHALEGQSCPVDAVLDEEVELARVRARDPIWAARAIEGTDWSAESLPRRLETGEALLDRGCIVHGDYCLPNLLIQGEVVAGVIDWGRGGRGDRHRDITSMYRSVAFNCGQAAAEALLALVHPKPQPTLVSFFDLVDRLTPA
jgi:aminoglycoside phosphotransferase